ncbi:MAG: O-antigen ligase family protein [Planctomycetota bacterium]
MSDGRQFIVRLLEGVTAFFLLLMAVLRPLASGNLLGLGDTIYVSLPVWFAMVSWLLRSVAAGRLRVFRAGGDAFLLLLMLLVLLSPRPPADMNSALPAAMVWATNILYLYLVVNVGREACFGRWVLTALLCTGVAITMYGAIQAAVDLPAMKRLVQDDPKRLEDIAREEGKSETLDEWRARALSARPNASFVNENSLAGFLALLAFPLLGLVIETDRRDWRFAARIVGLIGLLCLFGLCLSKGGVVGLGVGAYAFLWAARVGPFASRDFRWTSAGLLVLVVLLLVGISCWGTADPLQLHQKYSSAWYRIGYWTGAVRVFEAHPWMGVGLDNFQDHYYEWKDAAAAEVNTAHNDYLQVAAELGVFGLVAFVGFWALTLVRSFRLPAGGTDARPEGQVFLRLTTLVIGCIAAAALGPFVAEGLLEGGFLDCVPSPYSGLLLSSAWIAGFVALRPSPRQASSAWVRAGALAGLCAALAHAAIDNHFYVHGLSFSIWALAGVVIVLFQEARGEAPVLDLELGRGGALLTFVVAAAFCAVIGARVVPVMSRSQEKDAIYRRAKEDKTQPDFYQATRLAPWDPKPLMDLAYFRHSACRMMTREKLQEQTGGIGKPITVDATRYLPDLWRVCLPTLEDAIQVAPRDRSLRYWLGKFHEEHAERAYEIAAQEEGPQRGVLEEYGAGELEEALKAYMESYRLYPTRPENAWRVGRILARLGREGDARPYLEKALAYHHLQTLDRLKLPKEEVEDLERKFGGR